MKTSKILTLVIALMLTMSSVAQDKWFTVFGYTEPQHYSKELWNKADGFNLGAGIDYQMTIFYFSAEVFFFPGLNDLDYFHAQGSLFGVNYHTFNERWRFYGALIRPGFIIRDGGPHALFGQEAGIDFYFGNNKQLYVGARYTFDTKGDSKVWGSDSSHTVHSAGIKFGAKL